MKFRNPADIDRTIRRVLYSLTALLILGYFLYFTLPSFSRYFVHDDMYALYFAWKKPISQTVRENLFFWQGNFRPLGAFYYRGIFDAMGFDPVPFHFAHLAFCLLDLFIGFWVIRLLTASDRAAALGTLLLAFHSRLVEVWFTTTIIFDVLCFTFVWLTFGIYASGQRTEWLTWRRFALIVFLYLCALQSKEMAVCLPVFMVAYDLLFRMPRPFTRGNLRQLLRPALLYCLMGIMTVAYTWGKLHRPDMVNNPFYKPVYSFGRFAETWNSYMGALFVAKADLPTGLTISILAGLLAAAVVARSRKLVFAWVVIFFGMLPVSFSPVRGPYVMYVSYLGWVLYAAVVIVVLQDVIVRNHQRLRIAVACVVFVLVGWRLGKVHLHERRTANQGFLVYVSEPLRDLIGWLDTHYPNMAPHSSILLLNDNIPAEWTVMFALHIYYDDPTLTVDRARLNVLGRTPERDERRPARGYNYIFTWEDGQYKRVYSLPLNFKSLE